MGRKGISHRAVIELLGDMTAVANALGLKKPNTVAHWKRPGRGIPSLYWRQIAALAQARGYAVTVADLEHTSPAARARRRRMHRPGFPLDVAEAA